ncbi:MULTISPECIES: DUF397 domain-containing protein [unclassified Streptomyces]|uniref:DUF397 domain-containing protein n=1 Tax=unclassified Streptomyces TaxID=2593676 RepID=UPI000D1B44BA
MTDIPADLTWIRAAPEDDEGTGPWIEIAFGPDELVHLRETGDPANIVTTTRAKWDAFAKGVRAGEFDHFIDDVDSETDSGTDTASGTDADTDTGIGKDIDGTAPDDGASARP